MAKFNVILTHPMELHYQVEAKNKDDAIYKVTNERIAPYRIEDAEPVDETWSRWDVEKVEKPIVKRKIGHAPHDPTFWICLCGNNPGEEGFSPCDDSGKEVTPEKGWKEKYVCKSCGKIIDQRTQEVIGQSKIS